MLFAIGNETEIVNIRRVITFFTCLACLIVMFALSDGLF